MDPISTAMLAGLPPELARYMPRYVQIESGGNPNATTGSYSGLLQMGPDEISRYGGNGLSQGAKMYADRANWFQSKFGRAPSPTELYLTNQQGEGGIAAHLSNPSAPAWVNMASTGEGQRKGEAWAKKAIWGNVPDDLKKQYGSVDNLSSQDFINLWQHKVERSPLAAPSGTPKMAGSNPLLALLNGGTGGPQNPLMALLGGGDESQLPSAAQPIQYQPQQGGFDFSKIGDALQGLGAGLVTAANPGAGAAMMAQVNAKRYRNKPTFGVIGEKTDALGQTHKIYGWVNPNDQTATPLGGGSGGASGGADSSDLSTSLQNIRDVRANGGSTQDALKAVDPAVAPYVQALVEGRALPGNMGRGQARLRLMAIAHEVDPSLDEASYALRTQFAKNMGMSSPQSYGGQVNSANTIVAHLDSAMQQLPTLEKGVLGMTDVLSSGNNAKAYARDQMGDKEYKAASGRWNVATKGIADELEKLLAGSNGAEASKQYWLKQFDLNRGPTAVAASLDEARALMMGRLGSIAHQKETAYGTPTRAEDLLSPDARSAVPRITGGASDRAAAPAAPQGATETKTFGGKTYYKINGIWHN